MTTTCGRLEHEEEPHESLRGRTKSETMRLKIRQDIFWAAVAATIVAAVALPGKLTGATAYQEMSSPGNDQFIRVGIVQMNARVLDKSYNLKQAEDGIRLAAAQGAKIVLTPESAVQGYPRVDLHPGESMNDSRLMHERKRILAAAETIPGPSTRRFSELARKYGIWIVFGMDQNRGGRLFNTAVLMDPQGDIVGTYSKVHLQNWMVASGVQHGDGFPVWDIDVSGVHVKVGIEICYDVQHPESTLELALGGAEIVFIPYCTGSIIDYKGKTVLQLGDSPGVLVGDIDLTALRKARAEWNPVYGLPNRYPSAYKRLRGLQKGNASR